VTPGSFEFEGSVVRFEDGDSVASALYRSGVRTFSRSLKYHRRRGLYCGTGDCPNCLITVDGVPGVRSCTAEAREGMRVEREAGWPSTEFDVLAVTDRLHALMPVGFYYKTFVRPRFAWEVAEKVIRRATGLGRLSDDRAEAAVDARHVHPDVVVIGAGIAGLAAALEAAGSGATVVVAEEGRVGEAIAPGPTLERLRALREEARGLPTLTLLERHAAIGLFEGPMVALAGEGTLIQAHPGRVIVATGAAEAHGVFDGNDRPGVWLGRGAARMAGVHRVRPGERAVVVALTDEGLAHLETLRSTGVRVIAVVPARLADRVPAGVQTLPGAEVVRVEGVSTVSAVVVRDAGGERRISCDALIVSSGLAPRDGLLRMAQAGESVSGAGDVIEPGCSPEEAEASGRRAGRGEAGYGAAMPPASVGDAGIVCLCEDVSVGDLERAWDEGYTSSEILKRYTTATMGPCQGAMCGLHLAGFCSAKAPAAHAERAGARTTGAPPPAPRRLRRSPPPCTRSSPSEPRSNRSIGPREPPWGGRGAGCDRSPTATGARSTELSASG
jgi:sarcosine oxidase subunit alpha